MKKIVALILAMVLCLSVFAGCANNDAGKDGTTAANAGKETTAANAQPLAGTYDIKVWVAENMVELTQKYVDVPELTPTIVNEYIKKTICEMSERVITKLAAKYESIRKEVNSIMGGKVLEYEAKDILRKGIKEGIEVGKLETLVGLVKDNLLSTEEAAKRVDMTVEEFQKEM